MRYIRWLRDPERRSAKSKIDQEFTRQKSELIKLRIDEKRKLLMPVEKAVTDMERVIGCFLTKLSGMAPRVARVAGNSLVVRREVDAIVRKELAALFNKFADEEGEEPLELPPVGTTRPSEQAPTTDNIEEDEPA